MSNIRGTHLQEWLNANRPQNRETGKTRGYALLCLYLANPAQYRRSPYPPHTHRPSTLGAPYADPASAYLQHLQGGTVSSWKTAESNRNPRRCNDRCGKHPLLPILHFSTGSEVGWGMDPTHTRLSRETGLHLPHRLARFHCLCTTHPRSTMVDRMTPSHPYSSRFVPP